MAVPDPKLHAAGQLPSLPTTPANKTPAGSGEPGANRPIPIPSTNELGIPRDDDDWEDEGDLREALRNAPAWLFSTVFHMSLLIVLGLLAARHVIIPDQDVEVSYADPDDKFAEQLGTQLDNPSILEGDSSVLKNITDEPVITPKDLPPVDDPLAAPLAIGDIKIGPGIAAITGPRTIEGAPIGLALSGRRAGSKEVLLGRYGGTRTTEDAVERGLEWLAKQQKSDGSWSLSGPYPDGSASENNAAATAMALLAFQGHGDTHKSGKHAKIVARGWSALLKLQTKDGLFKGMMTETHQLLYTHAQCAIAICELYGMTNDSQYRGAAQRAIAYAVSAQDTQRGGWRYSPRQESDTSVTGWFVMALQSARMAKLDVPQDCLDNVMRYLDSAQIDDGRRYGYWMTSNPSRAMDAEGLLCRQYLGWRQNDPRLVEGVSALNHDPVAYDGKNQDVYYWYYATQATHHMEGSIWDDWNKVMRQEVPAHQLKSGPQAGSWDPDGDKWGTYGGRLYVTCLSMYMLEVYYRHLPIYSGYKFVAGVEAITNPSAKPANADDAKPLAKDEKIPPDSAASEDEK